MREYLKPQMILLMLMGFSSGLPLALSGSTLQAWATESGVSLSTVGLYTYFGLPYMFKFLWAPALDRFSLPFFGRRRGWMILLQLCLLAAVFSLGQINPAQNPQALVALAFLVCFLSASQDIVIDAYRTEVLPAEQRGNGVAMAILGYRLGMLTSGSLALILADHFSWSTVYAAISGCFLFCMLVSLAAPEPNLTEKPPYSFKAAVLDPLKEYFGRHRALEILLFVLLYKLGDVMAASLTTPFMLNIGFTKTEIGSVTKAMGVISTIAGALLGGAYIARRGLYKALWIFGWLQALSIFFFALLAWVGRDFWFMALSVCVENFSGGMGTSALTAFLMSLCSKRYTATQYALLSSLIAFPRTVLAGPCGFLAEATGWVWFFVICVLAAMPALLLLFKRHKDWELSHS